MTWISWTEAVNSGGAKEHKQKIPCIFCQYYPVLGGVFHEQYSPSTPNFEVIYPPWIANFMENRTLRSYWTIIKHFYQRIMLIFKKLIPPDEDSWVVNCNGKVIWSCDLLDQSRSSKITISYVTQQVKQKLTNRKLYNLAPHFLLVWGHTVASYT